MLTGTEQASSSASETKRVHANVNFSAATAEPAAMQHAHGKKQHLSAGAALESALSRIDARNRPGSKAASLSCTMRSTMKSTGRSIQSGHNSTMQGTSGRQMSRLASTRKLEKEQVERAERIRARNL